MYDAACVGVVRHGALHAGLHRTGAQVGDPTCLLVIEGCERNARVSRGAGRRGRKTDGRYYEDAC